MPFPEPIKGALEGAGFSGESLDRIRLARGFVGKASYVAGIALLVLGGLALRGGADPFMIVGPTVLIFTIYFGGTLWFAHRHPGEALLEGAELLKWRQLEMESAAKDITITPSLSTQTSPPLSIEDQAGGNRA